MGDSMGYNPYRDAAGKFTSPDNVGAKVENDLQAAYESGDIELATKIEDYAMDKMPESPLGQKLLEEGYGATATLSTADRELVSANAKSAYADFGARELQKLAKDSEDPELHLEVATRGNSNAIKNLLKNTHASGESLEKIYINADSDELRQQVAMHANADRRIMHPEHVGRAAGEHFKLAMSGPYRDQSVHREIANSILESDNFGDKELDAFRASGAKSKVAEAKVFENSSNMLSNHRILEEVSKPSPVLGAAAIKRNTLEPESIRKFHAESVVFAKAGSREPLDVNESYLREAADAIADGHWEEARERSRIANELIANEATPAEALEKLTVARDVNKIALYNSPKLSSEAKNKLASTSSEVQSHLRIEAAKSGRTTGELKQDLIISGGSNNTPTGYHSSSFMLDKAKIASYNLTKEDVESIMGDGYLYSYDEESGHYGGSYDSSG